ncbi:MAG: DDE-type integrase/transposase/recombinase [Myxococcota bacterium]
MAYRELKMIELKEVLRRREAGQSLRRIARETGLDRKTVRRYVDALEQAEGDDEERVQQMVRAVQSRPAPPASAPRKQLEAHRNRVRDWLFPRQPGQRPLRLTKVHVLLARRGVEVTYATLCRWAHDELGWRERTPTVRIDDPPPGEEPQVDFGKMGMLVDLETGKPRALWCLIVTLTCSRMQFVWPTFEQTTVAVCEGLDAAWAFFGGVVARVVVDNAKAMVVTPHATAPRITDAFAEYAQARSFFPDPARVRRPTDKPRVENSKRRERGTVRKFVYGVTSLDDVAVAALLAAAPDEPVLYSSLGLAGNELHDLVFDDAAQSYIFILGPDWVSGR